GRTTWGNGRLGSVVRSLRDRPLSKCSRCGHFRANRRREPPGGRNPAAHAAGSPGVEIEDPDKATGPQPITAVPFLPLSELPARRVGRSAGVPSPSPSTRPPVSTGPAPPSHKRAAGGGSRRG